MSCAGHAPPAIYDVMSTGRALGASVVRLVVSRGSAMVTKLSAPTSKKRSSLGVRRAARFTGRRWRTALLACGVVGPIWWVAWDVIGSRRYPGYSYVDQTISELSAQGAPTRTFMMLTPYTELMVAFGVGVWIVAGARRAGRITGAIVIAEAVWGFVGGLAFPMATREVMAAHQDTLRNLMHQWYGIGMPILFVLAVGFGSRLLGRRFRTYSYATILAAVVVSIVMSQQISAMAANEPTPWMGAKERVIAYLPMLWYVVLAIGLLRAEASMPRRQRNTPIVAPPVMHRWPQ
jgi:hypothetical protein